MSAGTYTGQMYLAKKTKPMAMRAADGTFVVQMLAFTRRAQQRGVTPWRLIYAGDAAQTFWGECGPDLVPGAVLEVQANDLAVVERLGKSAGPEIHAKVGKLAVVGGASA